MEGLLKRLHRGVHRMWSDTSTRAQVLSWSSIWVRVEASRHLTGC